jgi:hypothetical protein
MRGTFEAMVRLLRCSRGVASIPHTARKEPPTQAQVTRGGMGEHVKLKLAGRTVVHGDGDFRGFHDFPVPGDGEGGCRGSGANTRPLLSST